MSARPLYSTITIIVLLPLAIFIADISLTYLLGMEVIVENRIDKVLHFVGGVSISLAIGGIVWRCVQREIIDIRDVNVFRLVVFGCMCFAVISWEILEYIVNFESEYLTYSDTITDMVCGLIGGLLANVFFLRSNFHAILQI